MIKRSIYAVIALGMITVGLMTNGYNANDKSKFDLANLTALQSSATEMWCDASTNDQCTISSGGVTGYGTGVLHFVP